ncbi:MAG: DsbA family protein [Gemmatimonadota bacterium]|nr:DsbA family protein [Gemmatimonadota bacterium]
MRFVTLFSLACITGGAVACSGSETARGATPQPSAASAAHRDSTSASAQRVAGDTLLTRADAARIQGNPSATIWIIEISDFQCPYCKEWHDSTFAKVKTEFIDTGKARFAYINYPLSSHRNAMPAAEAAMCSAAQGKFWPMHDALFNSQEHWEVLPDPASMIDSIAKSIGVDAQAMRSCVTRHATRPLIQADVERSQDAGVNSTPTFLVNGTPLIGAQPIESFRKAVAAAALVKPATKP